MYKRNFVVVVKCNGAILREREGGTVYLPFGSQYSILLKNKHVRKASVSIEVDGKDVLNGHNLIMNPNTDSEVKGFMRNMSKTNKFKFINKTKQIQRHRGEKYVPTLCDAPQLKPFGACRVCSVEAALTSDGPTRTIAAPSHHPCYRMTTSPSDRSPTQESLLRDGRSSVRPAPEWSWDMGPGRKDVARSPREGTPTASDRARLDPGPRCSRES